VKLRKLLKKLRLQPLQGPGDRPVDNVDGMATMAGPEGNAAESNVGPVPFPPNYVPSQQEDRPRH